MKNIFFRMISILPSLTLLAAMLVGCGRDADVDADADVAADVGNADSSAAVTLSVHDLSDYTFLPEFTSITALIGDLPNISNVVIAGNTLYFTSTTDRSGTSLFSSTRIHALDLDTMALTYLPNYTTMPPTPEAEGGGVFISDLRVDDDGNIWVAETGSFATFNFPPNFDLDKAEPDEIREHRVTHEQLLILRKLDSTGAELQSIDVTHLSETSNWSGIFSFFVYDNENFMIGTDRSIIVLNADGEILFTLDTDWSVWPDSFIRLSDGRTAFFNIPGTGTPWALRTIDVQNRAWGDGIPLPLETRDVFKGFGEYLVAVNDGIDLSVIHADTGEVFPIINWAERVGVPAGQMGNLTFLPDWRILFTTTTFGQDGGFTPNIELITLSRIPRDELHEKITLTLSSAWLRPDISDAIAEFNRTNALYHIEVSEIDLNWDAPANDLTRLAMEIITGGGPDIIDVTNMPFNQWAARGLFVDLYEFIDADQTFNRDDIVDAVLQSAETNGRLYHIFPAFSVSTLTGSPDVLGSEPGWTLSDFISVLEANPQVTQVFVGYVVDGENLFRSIFTNHIDNFVNWETGTVDFDNDHFIEFLEFAAELRRVHVWSIEDQDYIRYVGDEYYERILMDQISSGEVIMDWTQTGNFNTPYIIQRFFGDDFVFKGYPTDSGSGNILVAFPRYAISSMSENQEGAWEFLRMIMSEQWQRENTWSWVFPTNRMAFEDRLERARRGDETLSWGPARVNSNQQSSVHPLLPEDTSAYVDITLALIDSVDGLHVGSDPILEIIFEGVYDMFAGRSTAQDAARIIQNRVSIFVAEQS